MDEKCIDVWINLCRDGLMVGLINIYYIDGYMDGWMNGWID